MVVFTALFLSGLPLFAQSEDGAEKNRTTVDHARQISEWDADVTKKGKKIYQTSCYTCHGEDGSGNIPAARSFTEGTFENGADPYSLFQTISNGYKQMPGQSWLNPSERYAVIHYIREAFLKEKNPDQYTNVTEEYLSSLPEPVEDQPSEKQKKKRGLAERLHGVLVSQLGKDLPAVLSVDVGHEITVSYDLHRMRTAATWQNGFVNVSGTKFDKLKGGANARPDGQPLTGLQSWYWAYGSELDYQKLDLPPRSPVPDKWVSFEGRYMHGDRITLHYTVNGRNILETPGSEKTSDFRSLNHTLRVGSGQKPLKLVAADVGQRDDDKSGVMSLDGEQPGPHRGPVKDHLAVASTDHFTASGPFFNGSKNSGGQPSGYVAAGVAGETDGLKWHVDDEGRLILSIPASERPRVIRVMRFAHRETDQLDRFQRYVNHVVENETLTDPKTFTKPGPNPFKEAVQVEGALSEKDQGYVVDTIPVPERDNPYGIWLRPAAIAFFDDGRAAVTSYTGDIWMVEALDESLEKVTWRRFATGLYEPLGARVIDGTLHVTCRDGIKRVHDYDGNGFADHVEQIYSDHDVSSNYHAYHFDLERDKQGNFYFSKAGRYTSFKLPGAVMKVSPDGERHEVFSLGFRVPNGMGTFPHNGKRYLTASDNQGHYTPVSKINVVEKGGFYGYSGSKRQWKPYGGTVDFREGDYPPDSFDPPMVWIPHSVDMSSGGQLWVDDKRFGPLSDHLLHTSWGSAKMLYVLPQKVGDTWQGGVVPLPHKYKSAIMRARVNPTDGQVYTVGLKGWNNPPNVSGSAFQRLRYAGSPARIIDSMEVTPDGLKLTFNFQVADGAKNQKYYTVKQWEYKWHSGYGSARYHPDTKEKGEEKVVVNEVQIGQEKQSILLSLDQLHEVQQMHVNMEIPTAGGQTFSEHLYLTVNEVPDK